MAMKFYGKAESAANAIVEAFQKPGELPEALAPIFIRRKDDVPCRQWSWSNQFIAALRGHADARGYRQWQAVGRHVRKGERGFPILVPLSKKIERENAETGESEERYVTYGFKHAIVFGLSQTDGADLETGDPETDAWLRDLPLRDVAEQWGLSIETYNGSPGGPLGRYSSNGAIALGVRNLATWCHELMHAADRRLRGSLKPGQDAEQEIVAELGAAVLLTILGQIVEADLGGCWEYVTAYADGDNRKAVAACQRLLSRVCDAVALILDTAESLKPETAAVA